MFTQPMITREFDVVLYGAGGFVGRQTVAYFVKNAKSVRWAVAGRNGEKLRKVCKEAGAGETAVIVADAHDKAALSALAGRTRVVLSTAGPFALYSDALVDACVTHKTHYVDITGETPWVRDLIARYQERTASEGTRIIPCCGVDSVPSDIGAWCMAKAIRATFQEPCAEVKASFHMRGGFNGGTLASLLHIAETDHANTYADPFSLTPAAARPVDHEAHRDPTGVHYDADFAAWMAPYVMGPINTRVVRRTVGLQAGASPFAKDFRYHEYMFAGPGVGGRVAGSIIALITAGFTKAASSKHWRKLLLKAGPSPGDGPSESTMEGGYLRGTFVGVAPSGKTLRGVFNDQGDPGNRLTTKFVCEAALTLVHDADALPGGDKFGGILSPVAGLGEAYVKRLRGAGVQVAFPSA